MDKQRYTHVVKPGDFTFSIDGLSNLITDTVKDKGAKHFLLDTQTNEAWEFNPDQITPEQIA